MFRGFLTEIVKKSVGQRNTVVKKIRFDINNTNIVLFTHGTILKNYHP